MSKVEVNTIEPQCGTTVTVGTCTSTIAVPGNVVKSNALQASDAGNIISQSGTTITVGASGDTVSLASGASQSGFGRTGTVDWQTDSIKTATFTATSGEGYFANTTGGVFNMNLPAGAAGSIVAVKDYLNTFDSNALTIVPNGSDKIGGTNANYAVSTEALSLTLVYVDATRGWVDIHESTQAAEGATFIVATGGNAVVTCGNYKTHIFTGPGTFCVASLSGVAANNVTDYLVIAGGGGGSGAENPTAGGRGGGGAGGGRTFQSTPSTNPATAPAGITVTASPYSIVVGGGGSAGPPTGQGGKGSTSTFSSIDSAGGGGGANSPNPGPACQDGGSGGGQYSSENVGVGNTPPVSPVQGYSSQTMAQFGGGAGGGWGGLAGNSAPTNAGAAGGVGSYIYDTFVGPTAPTYGTPGPVGSTRYFAGGGGGGGYNAGGGAGGAGGGANGANSYGPGGPGDPASPGTTNTGGGGGSVGAACVGGTNGGAGGSGIVMIRYRYQ